MKLIDTPLENLRGHGSGERDYERVARAIEFLRRNAASQPDLTAVARHLHLSEHHFQRLFTRWAGVSPKRFGQPRRAACSTLPARWGCPARDGCMISS